MTCSDKMQRKEMHEMTKEMRAMMGSGNNFRDYIVPAYRSAISAAGLNGGDIGDQAQVESQQ